jgi:prepilin-type N-terminal cleavage/methylation domain-containing protein
MKKLFDKSMKSKGFTLIEMVVVIAIIGVIAAAAVPGLIGFRDSAELTADRSSAAVIAKAAELHAASENMTGDEKTAFATSVDPKPLDELVTSKMLYANDIDPKSSEADFILSFNTTTEEFEVSLDEKKLYPVS